MLKTRLNGEKAVWDRWLQWGSVVVKEKEGGAIDGGVIKGSGRRCLGEGVCGFGNRFGTFSHKGLGTMEES